jgi:predicted alpha-1,2-mannosidase
MKIVSKFGFFIFLSFFLLSASETFSQNALIDYVDPNIGSVHSRWFFYTPAAHPFGMAKLGPGTNAHYGNKWGWEATGYDDRHTSIEGFAHFHEFQIGGVVVMPTVGELKTIPGTLEDPDGGYRSRFDKKDEIAQPGYYAVLLKDYGVKAELTATPRVGFHRYTFPQSDEAHILFDIGNRQGESGIVTDAFVRLVGDREVEGFVITHPEYLKTYQPGSQVKMYFVARLSKAPNSFGGFNGETIREGAGSAQGPGAGLYLTFDTREGETLEIKVGLSYTSTANARLNLEREAANLTFDQARTSAHQKWEQELGKIRVEGGKPEDRLKFYTGLYHALLGRGLASDVNGAYPKNDGGVGHIPLNAAGDPQYHHYNTDAVWGGFWNLTQLWALAYPAYYNDFVRCQLDHFKDCGWLPDGTACGKFASGVGTNFMGLLVASAYARGIRDYSVDTAYMAVVQNELGWQNRPEGVGKADTKVFVERGYVPMMDIHKYYSASTAEGSTFSASHTMEYSFSAYAAGQFAKALGKEDDYRQFTRLARGWENLFDPETGLIRPRNPDGSFIDDFDPYQAWRGFQEGNAWQYTFYVPHDPAGLTAKAGGEKLVERLEWVFEEASRLKFGGGETIDAFSGIESPYNHGNQPSLHMAWLFNYLGKPWLTQRYVREICDVFYGTTGLHGYGYGQDEDQGQLGAWLVLAGIGLFDVQGGTSLESSLQLSAPLFDRVTIELDEQFYPGKKLEIVVKGNPAANPYIQSVQWKGQALNNCWFPWSKIVQGGKLEITVGEQPNTDWGIEMPPPSMDRD